MSPKSQMDRRSFLKNFPKKAIIALSAAYAFKSFAKSKVCEIFTGSQFHEEDPSKILKEIYREVIELGRRDEEHFIKREFFINLDGNDENKEEHVVFLNYKVGDREKVLIQVTYFESRRKNSIVKYPKNTKGILYYLRGEEIEIKECDYDERELKPLLVDILEGIRNKKEILKLLKRKY